MLAEEYAIIAGSAQNLATPAAPTCTVRNAQSNETALNTTVDHVLVAATNYFGTTAVSGSTAVTVSAGQVVDVTIAPSAGAMQYSIWGLVSSTYYLLATCGGVKYTLQGGTLPAASTQPTADSGTGKGTRIEGVIPVLSGLSQQAGVYPSGWQGGYYNGGVGLHFNYNTIYRPSPAGRTWRTCPRTSSPRAPAPPTSCSSSRARSATSPSARPSPSSRTR